MGISGLLPLLKSIHKPCHVRKFKGQTIGVDAYGWLHRGTVSCAIDLALDKPVTKYVDFAMHRVRMLIHFGVTPYIVFDGDHLPSKAATEIERAKRRQDSRRLGLELYNAGKISQAHLELQKAVDVTPYMARLLIEELKKLNIQYVVAPYEADAQLVYLERKGLISGILSEDSDMLVFGARRLLTKLEQYGDCVEINRVDFTACRDISLIGWTDADFRRMAILSGCDYLANINKMGVKTAYRYVRRYKSIEKVLQMLQFEGKFRVPAGYLENFRQAELTFIHQRVYCPLSQRMVMLTELDGHAKEEDLSFIGAFVDQETIIGVACGDLDPITKEPIVIRRGEAQPLIRRQTLAGSEVKVYKRPIDSFFKPKRQPLAELDPNSLTPSPSQQRLLNNVTPTWSSNVAPSISTSGSSRISFPAGRPSSSQMARSSHREQWLTRAAIVPSQPSSAKRQRLCSDADESVCENEESSKSKFFPSKPEPSPLIGRNGRAKKAKKSDINIFSDESLDEELGLLPDISDSIKASKMFVLSDNFEVEPTTGSPLTESPDTSGDSTLVSETSAMSNVTPGTSVAGSIAEEESSVAREKMAKLAQTFVFGKRNNSFQLSSGSQQQNQSPPVPKSRSVKVATTPVKLQHAQSEPILHREDFAAEISKFASLQEQSDRQPNRSPSVIRESSPVCGEPASPTQGREVRDLKTVVTSAGSEDQIIPDSEDEGSDVPEMRNAKLPNLNLGKFVYTPKVDFDYYYHLASA